MGNNAPNNEIKIVKMRIGTEYSANKKNQLAT